MRIGVTIGGESIGVPGTPAELIGQACAAEADGFPAAWSVHVSRGVDALAVLAVAGTRASRIDLGVGIVPTFPRRPLAPAQQAATAPVFCGGRLTLAAHMRGYPSVLVPLLRTGSVTHAGEHYRVDGGFVVPGTDPVSVVVGALAPRMRRARTRLAGGGAAAARTPRPTWPTIPTCSTPSRPRSGTTCCRSSTPCSARSTGCSVTWTG